MDLSRVDVERFLSSRHAAPISQLEPLHGGYWSSAFGYRVGDQDLVARFGTMREGFERDRAAMAFGGPDLPVPAVLEIGDAFHGAYALSVRHYGRFLEHVRPEEAETVGPTIVRLLAALRAVPAPPDATVTWFPEGSDPDLAWRDWVRHGFVDDPSHAVSGWRAKLAADTAVDRLFRAAEDRVGALIDACPERRDLLHGDLLHANVLVSEDASRVTGVFSWKCSERGDFLFDVALLTFWSPWYPGIAAANVWDRVLADRSITADALSDAAERHHCYEVQIGGSHLGWNVFTGNDEALRDVAARLEMVLDRGPLAARLRPT